MRIVISSGHGLHVQGAVGLINERDENRRVVGRVSEILRGAGVAVVEFHEDTAKNGNDNVNNLWRFHNTQTRDLDVQIHFNASSGTQDAGIGVETLHLAGDPHTHELAARVSKAISDVSGLILRRGDGTWARTTEVGFLRFTNRPAILPEVCFVNSHTDVRLYQEHFEEICRAIAESISGRSIPVVPPQQQDHWAEPAFQYLLNMGIHINERRFDDPVTRGELFAMLERYDRSYRID